MVVSQPSSIAWWQCVCRVEVAVIRRCDGTGCPAYLIAVSQGGSTGRPVNVFCRWNSTLPTVVVVVLRLPTLVSSCLSLRQYWLSCQAMVHVHVLGKGSASDARHIPVHPSAGGFGWKGPKLFVLVLALEIVYA